METNYKFGCFLLPNMAVLTLVIFSLSSHYSPARASAHRNSCSVIGCPDSTETDSQTYIVHVKKQLPAVSALLVDRDDYYTSFLAFGINSVRQPQRLLHTYHNVFSGFAARLTQNEVKMMQQMDGFISAMPEKKLKLLTTHTPNFLGLNPNIGFWNDSNFGKGVIVGLLDSGVFPSHPSFSDQNMPPPPAKWKGRCDFNMTTAGSGCNKKIIGARNLVSGTKNTAADTPLDIDGHGTHTASTAAGAFVKNAEVLGNAYGTAAGMAPLAHLAIYKVCSVEDCLESDMLAGLDTAVEDGVDVLSVSLGVEDNNPFYLDAIAIGSFGAMQKGIFVSCSAANSGPFNSTLSNDAPWILTVGASTMDRSIRTSAKLGNGKEYNGESLFQPKDFPSKLLPLVYAGANGKADSAFCGEGSLNGSDVKGKVVLCERGGDIARIDKGVEVVNAGGAAMILMNDETNGFSTEADAHVLPASHISFLDGLKIKAYINSSMSSTPMATIGFKGTVIGCADSPVVTSFSSRGPSLISPGILKPDIIGPGVSVLAAWPFPLDVTTSTSRPTFNIISGTSMSCPHLSGIAALLKSVHPNWSPAMIKSAIMTSADLLNLEGKPILDQSLQPADLFATGAGHVNPSRAHHPGLVYDIQPSDYIPYLCGLGYTDEQVGILAHQTTIKCSEETSMSEGDLNYPTFAVRLGAPKRYNRTVTNVGEVNSFYQVQIVAPKGVDVRVEPPKLHFTEVNQKLTYSVSFVLDGSDVNTPFAQGSLRWASSKYSVNSPISVTFV